MQPAKLLTNSRQLVSGVGRTHGSYCNAWRVTPAAVNCSLSSSNKYPCNNVIIPGGMRHGNHHSPLLYYHSHRQISTEFTVLTVGVVVMTKKFITVKFLSHIGWKRIYRYYYRGIINLYRPTLKKYSNMNQNIDDDLNITHYKYQKAMRMKKRYIKGLTKAFRKSGNFMLKYPRIVPMLVATDRIITNVLLLPFAKVSQLLHYLLRRSVEKRKERMRGMQFVEFPTEWQGPLMLDKYSMVSLSLLLGLSSNYGFLFYYYLYGHVYLMQAWLNINCNSVNQFAKIAKDRYDDQEHLKDWSRFADSAWEKKNRFDVGSALGRVKAYR